MKIYSDGTIITEFLDPFEASPERIQAFLEEPVVEYIDKPFEPFGLGQVALDTEGAPDAS